MKQKIFESRYSETWQQFEQILLQLEKRPNSSQRKTPNLKAEGEFAQYYRQICHSLSLAKQRRYSGHLIDRLNDLAIRGHQQLYRRRLGIKSAIVRFFLVEYPALIRQEANYFRLACGLFAIPAVVIGLLIVSQPGLIYSVFSPEQIGMFESMYDPDVEHIGRERQSDDDFVMFGFYIRNNIGVSFRTFAGGIVFGLGSVFFLAYNGIIIGAVAGHITNLGYIHTFYSFVVGHGAFELTAICLSGAAGLKMGFALISPGREPRVAALKKAATIGVKMLYGVVMFLLIAAFLEAYWSSMTSIPVVIKYCVAAGFWGFVILYFAVVGRPHET